MKALLIVVFSVLVTTITSQENISRDKYLISNQHNIELVENDRSNNNESHLENCSEKSKGVFSLYDYSVILTMLIVSMKIGVFYGFFQKSSNNSKDFMLGSQMSLFPVTLSLTSSFVTAIELLGNPAEMFFYGGQFAAIVVSMILVIPVALKVFYPIYHDMQLTSCYEYLGMRFGRQMRTMGGTLYIIQMCFYTSVSVLAPAIALSKATGLNTRLAIVLIYVVCVFYSSQGGLKAVVIADAFQSTVFLTSMILIVILGTYYQPGGFSAVFKIASANDRLELTNFDLNPHTRHSVFSVVIGGFFYWTSLFCVNQATVQKSMSLKCLHKAKIAMTVAAFGLAAVFLINFYTGLLAFAHFKNCDPMKSEQIDAIDQLMPFFVMDVFGHIKFFVGFFVAGIFAASLGTVAACLSSLSAVTIEDLLRSGMNIDINPQKGALYAKWMSVGYGIFSFGLIFLVEGRGILQATLTLNGLVGGILLGLFCLGIFFKRANAKGAFYGGIISISCVLLLGITAQIKNKEEPFLDSSNSDCGCILNSTLPEHGEYQEDSEDSWFSTIYNISYMYYSMIGTLLTIFFGLIFSIISDMFSKNQVLKITSSLDIPKGIGLHSGFHTPGHFSVASFTLATGRKVTSFIQHLARDVSNSTLKVEHKLKEVISHTNLHHLHPSLHIGGDAEERIGILADEEGGRKDLSSRKMFFIGYYEDEDYESRSRRESHSDSFDLQVKPHYK